MKYAMNTKNVDEDNVETKTRHPLMDVNSTG